MEFVNKRPRFEMPIVISLFAFASAIAASIAVYILTGNPNAAHLTGLAIFLGLSSINMSLASIKDAIVESAKKK